MNSKASAKNFFNPESSIDQITRGIHVPLTAPWENLQISLPCTVVVQCRRDVKVLWRLWDVLSTQSCGYDLFLILVSTKEVALL